MFSRRNTLPRKDFQKVFREGRGYTNNTFVLKVLENKLSRVRVGVGVSAKVTKKSTKRNYYKRALRHILKESIHDLNVSYDVVFILQGKMGGKNFEELKKDAKQLLYNAGF